MQQRTIIEAVALGSISVVLEDLMIWSELLVGLVCRHLKDHNHEGAHQESSVDHFVTGIPRGAVMENTILLVILISKESGKFSSISVNHSKVQWAEVLVEWEVSEIVVDVKEECILVVLWCLVIRNPIEFI